MSEDDVASDDEDEEEAEEVRQIQNASSATLICKRRHCYRTLLKGVGPDSLSVFLALAMHIPTPVVSLLNYDQASCNRTHERTNANERTNDFDCNTLPTEAAPPMSTCALDLGHVQSRETAADRQDGIKGVREGGGGGACAVEQKGYYVMEGGIDKERGRHWKTMGGWRNRSLRLRRRHQLSYFSCRPGQRLLHDERLLLPNGRHGDGEHILSLHSHTDQRIISDTSQVTILSKLVAIHKSTRTMRSLPDRPEI